MSSTPATIAYSQLKSELKCGDIILFQGFDVSGLEIMALELAEKIEPFTHVGIVVPMPENSGLPAGLYFWHAVPADATQSFGPDYYKQTECNGCVLVSLDAVMDWVNLQDTSGTMQFSLIARQISPALAPDDEFALIAYTRYLAGRSFSTPVDTGMMADYFEGVEAVKKGGTSSADDTFFCSKLASQTFQQAGLLPPTLVTNSVLPGHFGENVNNTKLQFLKGYGFGEEIFFSPT